MRDALAALFFACLALTGPGARAQDPFASHGCAAGDKACRFAVIKAHAVHKLASWKADRAQPVVQRVHAAPAMLVEYLELENAMQGFPEKPRPHDNDAAFVAEVQGALRDLPPAVLRVIAPKLVGVYLVDDLGGTGFTDVVFDEKGEPAGGYIVLDAAVLQRYDANAWATWKENTPFKPDPAWQLQARIEDPAGDNRKNAVQYILLHELGHVLAIGADFHPPWWKAPKEAPATPYPFFELSWRLDRDADQYAVLPQQDFALRKDVVYYLGAKLGGAQMRATYDALERTNFVSLYGATRPGDDFAEAFASYVHVRLLHRPWAVTLSHDGAVVKTFGACWAEPRCAGKRAALEKLLAE